MWKHLKPVCLDGLPAKKKNDKLNDQDIDVVNVDDNGAENGEDRSLDSSDESYKDSNEKGDYSEDEHYEKDEFFINEFEIAMMDEII